MMARQELILGHGVITLTQPGSRKVPGSPQGTKDICHLCMRTATIQSVLIFSNNERALTPTTKREHLNGT